MRPAANARRKLLVELLETRDLPSGLHPEYVILPHGSGSAAPFSSAGPTGFSPTQIRQAYGFNQITFNNGVAADGSGTTIAVVDAYDDPNIANDLHQFDLRFGLPDPAFAKVNQTGGSAMPTADAGWASEIALDVEWAHAIAPKANILLVEASDNSFTNLFAAVGYAAKQPGVVTVSMSWGGGEFSGENSYDSVFRTPAGHTGVTFVISSGDSGAPASYPATSPNVLSVGGTTLQLNSSGNISSETGWSGSGGGVSAYESKPGYQAGVVTQSSSFRTSPDVSYDADPNTGFPVYDSYNNPASAPWSQFGGTSDAAPQWAALIAIADQGRMQAGLGALDGATQTIPKLYALPATDFHDVVSGTSTGSPNLSASAGYDLVTGRGTPYANKIVADLIGQTASTPTPTHFGVTSSATSSVAGSSFTITVTALDSTGHTVSGYLGTVHLTSTDAGAVLPANYTFVAADHGVHSFVVTLKTAGNQSLTATDMANNAMAGSVSDTVVPAQASRLAISQQPTNATVGTAIAPAVTVYVVDAYGNRETGDNTDKVTISIGANPRNGVLGGTLTATVSAGIASFSGLQINNPGNGYTLVARSGTLTSATSAPFNITAKVTVPATVIEDFETDQSWYIANGSYATAWIGDYAAHDGGYGLDQYDGNDWIYRTDAGAQLKAGDTASVWLQLSGVADGRAYFGFGASAGGTLSLVAAPNTGQLMLQSNVNFGFTTLAAVNATYQADHWYRLEVNWSKSGAILGKLYDSDGKTLLTQVSASTSVITSGGIAFRATGSDKFWDTVTAKYGVNNFARAATVASTQSSLVWSRYSSGSAWLGGGAIWLFDTQPQAQTNRLTFSITNFGLPEKAASAVSFEESLFAALQDPWWNTLG